MNIEPSAPDPPAQRSACCRLCSLLFDDLVDARHHFSTGAHPIRATDRRELSPRDLSLLIDSRIQVMTLADPATASSWIKSADAAAVMQHVVRNPSVFDDAQIRSQMRDMAQTPARAGRSAPPERVPEPEPTVRYAVEVHVDGAKSYHLVAVPASTATYYGLLGALERGLPGVDVGALVERRWVVRVSSREVREVIHIGNAADVVRAMAMRGPLVARKMIIG